jgi:hypothetical protein
VIQTLTISVGSSQLQSTGAAAAVAKTLPATAVPAPRWLPTRRIWRVRPASWIETQLWEKPSTWKAAPA